MNNRRTNLRIAMQVCSISVLTVFIAASTQAQSANKSYASRQQSGARSRPVFPWTLMLGAWSLTPAAAPGPHVVGDGTVGRLTKWTSFTLTNSVIGNSTIFEDRFGKVGIGTDTPTSRLTVAGLIETTLGGLKFPDGTVQTTAALNGSQFLFHDSTLRGDGVNNSPLGVALPLKLIEAVANGTLVSITNVGNGGTGVTVRAGDMGGTGIEAHGGDNGIFAAGDGVIALGGSGTGSSGGGRGLATVGGDSENSTGGIGLEAAGGNSSGDFGGDGVGAFGGVGTGVGKTGGIGILAAGGSGENGAGDGFAGLFFGSVHISGILSKGGGSFKIDHPLDPENKYLYHSFVESPDMMNIYNGNAVTNTNGDAVVELPAYFEALNRDFRYQLTVIGTFAQAMVAEKIKGNKFRIKTNAPGVEVSWQVTGIRQDAYANKHRIQVEEAKPEPERGTYLHPESFGQPAEKNVLFVQHPQLSKRMNETREKVRKARVN